MGINEIRKIFVKDKSLYLLEEHLVDVSELDRIDGFVKICFDSKEIKLPLYSSSCSKEIYSEKDLQNLLMNLGLNDIDIVLLRLKIINTKKWGRKPVYIQGADSIYFSCYHAIIDNENYFIFYNTSGTKAIEYLYIHGIWRSNAMVW
jgi:hypothetical protein